MSFFCSLCVPVEGLVTKTSYPTLFISGAISDGQMSSTGETRPDYRVSGSHMFLAAFEGV